MRSLLLSFILFFAICSSTAYGKFLSLNEIGEAACRVRVSGSAGSGTSIAADDRHIYVLTNAHVVGSSRQATCEFFRYGRKTQRLPGSVIWKSHSNRSVKDFAIIRIDKSLFGEFPPRIVDLAPVDHVVKQNDYIASAGCPQARWLQLWEGHALSEASNNRVLFTPPPLGGQSGSGVFTVIDGDTYLCAVLTWRIESDKGGAIHIGNFLRAVKGEASHNNDIEIPESWQYAAATTQQSPTTQNAYYALGSNGTYYLQNFNSTGWQRSVTLPVGHEGVSIAKWNVILRVQCPGGRCPPFISPPNNQLPPNNNPPENGPLPPNGEGNPYGVLPPNFGEKVPDKNKVIDEYKITIDALKKEIEGLVQQVTNLNVSLTEKTSTVDTLVQEKEALNTTLSEKEEGLKSLNTALDLLKSDNNFGNERIQSLNKRIGVLNENVHAQLDTVKNLKGELDEKGRTINGLSIERNSFENQSTEVKKQRNILGWLLGGSTGGLAWILTFYWKLRGKARARDMIEDRWNHSESTDSAPLYEAPTQQDPTPEPESVSGSGSDLRGLADYLRDTLESVLDNKIGIFKQEVDDKIDKIQAAASKDIDLRIYNNIDDTDQIKVSPSSENPNNKCAPSKDCDDNDVLNRIQEPSFPKASSRIKDFVELKRSDGEKVEELAFYAHLYKEAVDLLKENRLIITKNAAPFKVGSQAKAADAIDLHVQNQFLKRVSSATINRHILYHEAMIGFLYRQAIVKLKRGEFNVLGYKEVAESIERWVKTEFMKRMGFEF
jgi:hypothetical protein